MAAAGSLHAEQLYAETLGVKVHQSQVELDEVFRLHGRHSSFNGEGTLVKRLSGGIEGVVLNRNFVNWDAIVVCDANPGDRAVYHPESRNMPIHKVCSSVLGENAVISRVAAAADQCKQAKTCYRNSAPSIAKFAVVLHDNPVKNPG